MRMYRSPVLLAVVTAMVVAVTVPAGASIADSGRLTWHEDLFGAAVTRVNITAADDRVRLADLTVRLGARPGPTGFLVTPAHRVAAPVGRVRADVTATVPAGAAVAVEVRGRSADRRWSEWTPVDRPAVLGTPATTVQFRLALTAGPAGGPSVSDLSVTADRTSTAAAGPSARSVTYRLFATREGLVGGRTANGHIIVQRDHFVALPSRRGLNAQAGGRTYQVRVCHPGTGRCETAPVWDVGPWNTTDDYWNPSTVRQSWTDLPRGMPEAQAARLNGYNGGRDGFGRTVLNPAGIDLADGTFWDGLGMTDNGWVDVTFLWT